MFIYLVVMSDCQECGVGTIQGAYLSERIAQAKVDKYNEGMDDYTNMWSRLKLVAIKLGDKHERPIKTK